MSAFSVRITVLVDNRAGEGLTAEHGFALWVEAGGRRLLFDTGAGKALAPNAAALGLDPARTQALVLSHGHWDHTGGIAWLRRQAPLLEVFAHPGVVQPRYSIRDGSARAIQMPGEAMAALDALEPARVHWVQAPLELAPGVGLTGPIPRETDFEDPGGPFYLDPEGRRPDPIEDDLALWIRTGKGLVVCVGCAHAGLVNTLRQVGRLHPGEGVRAVMGGLHLGAASPRRLDRTVAALAEMGLERVVPCHCTGDDAVARLQEALGDRVTPGAAGMSFTF